MTKHQTMTLAGAALVLGFFMPWIDLGGLVQVSGWEIVRDERVSTLTRLILALCPLGGAALAFAGFTKSPAAAKLSLAMGLGVLGYTGLKLGYMFFKVTGWGLWLVLAAGFVALVTSAVRSTEAH